MKPIPLQSELTVDFDQLGELTVDIIGLFYPAEPEIRYLSDGSGDPGCPAYIDDLTAFYQGTEQSLSKEDYSRAEAILLDLGEQALDDGDDHDDIDPSDRSSAFRND